MMDNLIEILLAAKATFIVRWCAGEEVPCWEISIENEDKDGAASFSFNADGYIDNVFVY